MEDRVHEPLEDLPLRPLEPERGARSAPAFRDPADREDRPFSDRVLDVERQDPERRTEHLRGPDVAPVGGHDADHVRYGVAAADLLALLLGLEGDRETDVLVIEEAVDERYVAGQHARLVARRRYWSRYWGTSQGR